VKCAAAQGTAMQILNFRSNAWGQQVLEGANLHLVIVFLAAGVVLIVVHALVSTWLKRRTRESADG
jgi:hypothetical protein